MCSMYPYVLVTISQTSLNHGIEKLNNLCGAVCLSLCISGSCTFKPELHLPQGSALAPQTTLLAYQR